MIYILVKKLWNKDEALMASLLYLNTPLIRYFGKIPVHETITPFFILLVFYSYWLWFKKNSPKKYLFLMVSIFLAEQSGWPGFYCVPLISFHYLVFAKKQKKSPILAWWLLSFLSFAFFLLTIYWITGKFLPDGLWKIFLTRTAIDNFNKGNPPLFTPLQFLTKELLWLRVYFTRILSFLVIAWIVNLFFALRKKKVKPEDSLLILMGILGLVHILLFRHLAWFHDYMLAYLFLFLAIVVAKFLFFLANNKLNYFVLLMVMLIIMYLESKNFLKALESNMDSYPGYELGIFVHQTTQGKESVFIGCLEASKIYGVYFYYYADRIYFTGEPSLNDFLSQEKFYQENYKQFIVDVNHNRLEQKLMNYLANNYRFRKIGQFQVFDLRERLK